MFPVFQIFDTFMTTFKSIVGLMAGRTAVRETTKLIHSARLALIGIIAASAIFFVCLLIISVYFLIQIVQMF